MSQLLRLRMRLQQISKHFEMGPRTLKNVLPVAFVETLPTWRNHGREGPFLRLKGANHPPGSLQQRGSLHNAGWPQADWA